jgi:hypothetical protein
MLTSARLYILDRFTLTSAAWCLPILGWFANTYSQILRHMMEDNATLAAWMEAEVRAFLTGPKR